MEAATELRRYFEILRRRAAVILVITALAVGGVVLQLGTQPSLYETEVSMLVVPQSLGVEAGHDLQSGFRDSIMNNIMFLMRSRALLQRAGDRLGMSASALASRVGVKHLTGTDVMSVVGRDNDPERAALIANTVTQEFAEYYSQLNRSEATGARKFIEDQLSRTKDRLVQSEEEMLAFKSRTGAVGLSDQASRMVGRAFDMQAQYDAALLEQKTSQAKMDAIRSRLRAQSGQVTQLSVQTNPIFGKLRDTLTSLEIELATLRQTYTDEHPKVQLQFGKIAAIKKEMTGEATRVAAGQSLSLSPIQERLTGDLISGQVDAEAARARTAGMSQILAKMQAGLNTIPANELTFARLQRNVKVHEEMYLRLSALYEDSLIKERKAGSSGQATVLVVDPATVPSTPVSKRLPGNALMAALLGVVVGAAVALLLDGVDDRVRSANEAEGAYGLPVLAVIPTMNARSHRHLSGAAAVSTVSLPVVIAALLGLGVAALSLYLVHQSVASDQAAFIGRLFDVFQTVR